MILNYYKLNFKPISEMFIFGKDILKKYFCQKNVKLHHHFKKEKI